MKQGSGSGSVCFQAKQHYPHYPNEKAKGWVDVRTWTAVDADTKAITTSAGWILRCLLLLQWRAGLADHIWTLRELIKLLQSSDLSSLRADMEPFRVYLADLCIKIIDMAPKARVGFVSKLFCPYSGGVWHMFSLKRMLSRSFGRSRDSLRGNRSSKESNKKNHLGMMRTDAHSVPVLCKLWEEDGEWIASAEGLAVAACGSSFEDARKNLDEAIACHFVALQQAGQLKQVIVALRGSESRTRFEFSNFASNEAFVRTDVPIKENQEACLSF